MANEDSSIESIKLLVTLDHNYCTSGNPELDLADCSTSPLIIQLINQPVEHGLNMSHDGDALRNSDDSSNVISDMRISDHSSNVIPDMRTSDDSNNIIPPEECCNKDLSDIKLAKDGSEKAIDNTASFDTPNICSLDSTISKFVVETDKIADGLLQSKMKVAECSVSPYIIQSSNLSSDALNVCHDGDGVRTSGDSSDVESPMKKSKETPNTLNIAKSPDYSKNTINDKNFIDEYNNLCSKESKVEPFVIESDKIEEMKIAEYNEASPFFMQLSPTKDDLHGKHDGENIQNPVKRSKVKHLKKSKKHQGIIKMQASFSDSGNSIDDKILLKKTNIQCSNDNQVERFEVESDEVADKLVKSEVKNAKCMESPLMQLSSLSTKDEFGISRHDEDGIKFSADNSNIETLNTKQEKHHNLIKIRSAYDSENSIENETVFAKSNLYIDDKEPKGFEVETHKAVDELFKSEKKNEDSNEPILMQISNLTTKDELSIEHKGCNIQTSVDRMNVEQSFVKTETFCDSESFVDDKTLLKISCNKTVRFEVESDKATDKSIKPDMKFAECHEPPFDESTNLQTIEGLDIRDDADNMLTLDDCSNIEPPMKKIKIDLHDEKIAKITCDSQSSIDDKILFKICDDLCSKDKMEELQENDEATVGLVKPGDKIAECYDPPVFMELSNVPPKDSLQDIRYDDIDLGSDDSCNDEPLKKGETDHSDMKKTKPNSDSDSSMDYKIVFDNSDDMCSNDKGTEEFEDKSNKETDGLMNGQSRVLEFDILDEFDNNDDDNDRDEDDDSDSADSDISLDELDAMLDANLQNGKHLGCPSKTKDAEHEEKQKVILKTRSRDHFDVLPEGWIEVTHNSGMPIYLHKVTRVCSVSKPYFLGPGSTRKHAIPVSAIPCLHYLKELEKERIENEEKENAEKGQSFPPAKLESVKDAKESGSLDIQAVRDYCKKRFEFQTITIKKFKTWSGRRKHQKKMRQKQRPLLPDCTKLITCPLPPAPDKITTIGNSAKREFIMNPSGKSPVCILHEYVQHTLKVQPRYIFKELENASTPYGAVLVIGDVEYGSGYGSSKKQAKAEAAKSALNVLIPKMKMFAPEGYVEEQQDVQFFDEVRVEDPRVCDLSVKAGQPHPYQILLECLKRNYGMGDTEIEFKMRNIKHQKNEFVMTVGKHSASIVCKNKRDGKHRASQAILQLLHPHISSWGSLLRMYGKGSVKTLKEKKEEEQRITELQSQACANKPNMSILNKLKSEMLIYRAKMKSKKPIGKLIPEQMDLSTSDSNLKNVEL